MKSKKVESVLLGLIIIVILTISGAIFGWVLPVVIVAVSATVFALIYFVFAPRNMWFTFIEEGTAKWVVRGSHHKTEQTEDGKVFKVTRGGRPIRCLIQWEGYTISQETGADASGIPVAKWDVIKEGTVINGKIQREPHRLLGGFCFFGWYPLDRIYTYAFEWTAITENGEIRHHPKEKLDYIMLKDDVYWGKIEDAEDIELLPLVVEMLFTIRVVNTYKALFAVQNWLEMVINRSKPAVRNVITSDKYSQLIKKAQDIGELIYEDLKQRKLLEDEYRGRYGIDLRKTEVKEVDPREEHREATLKRWLGEREAEARTEETMGTVVRMMAKAYNVSPEEIQQEIESTPELKKEFRGFSQDLILRRMAIDGGSFIDIRTPQGTTLEGLFALWQRMPKGTQPRGKGKEKKGKEEEKSSERLDEKEEFEGLMGQADEEAKRLGID